LRFFTDVWKQKESSRQEEPDQVGCVIDSAALLDLWTEENVEDQIRTQGYLRARTPKQLIHDLGTNLGLGGIDYALTGAGGRHPRRTQAHGAPQDR
jgi:hypothetical protein